MVAENLPNYHFHWCQQLSKVLHQLITYECYVSWDGTKALNVTDNQSALDIKRSNIE